MVWAFFWKITKNGTKGENRLAIRTKQVHYMVSLSEMVQILKAFVRHFRRFITPKWKCSDSLAAIGVTMSIGINCMDIKCMDRGAVVVQLRRHKWLGL